MRTLWIHFWPSPYESTKEFVLKTFPGRWNEPTGKKMPKQLSYTDSSDFNSDDDEVRTEDEGSLAELRQKSSSIAR